MRIKGSTKRSVVNIGIIITSTWGKDGLTDKDLRKPTREMESVAKFWITVRILDHGSDKKEGISQ